MGKKEAKSITFLERFWNITISIIVFNKDLTPTISGVNQLGREGPFGDKRWSVKMRKHWTTILQENTSINF